jgi:hypothetical protein
VGLGAVGYREDPAASQCPLFNFHLLCSLKPTIKLWRKRYLFLEEKIRLCH